MKLATIIVTRSKAVHVKTLHTVLRLNLHCIQRRDTQNEVVYVSFRKLRLLLFRCLENWRNVAAGYLQKQP